jgi:hypothetical protein
MMTGAIRSESRYFSDRNEVQATEAKVTRKRTEVSFCPPGIQLLDRGQDARGVFPEIQSSVYANATDFVALHIRHLESAKEPPKLAPASSVWCCHAETSFGQENMFKLRIPQRETPFSGLLRRCLDRRLERVLKFSSALGSS